MFRDMFGVWEWISLEFGLHHGTTLKILWSHKQIIWLYFLKPMTIFACRKCPFAAVFASLTSLIWSCFHNLISPCSWDLSHSWGAEICFSLFLHGAHCFGLKALLIWLTLITLLSTYFGRRQLFVINPAKLTLYVEDVYISRLWK